MTFDDLTRRAVDDLDRRTAPVVDADAGLARLRDGTEVVPVRFDDPARRGTGALGPDRTGFAHRWQVWAGAAAAVAVIAVGVAVLRDDPAGPVGTPDPSVPVTDPQPTDVGTTVPDSSPTAPTVAPATTSPGPETFTVDLDTVESRTAEAEELGRFPVGDGPGELFAEPFEEGDPTRPWAPVVAADGTLVVADLTAFLAVGPSSPTPVETIVPDDGRIVASPVVYGDRLFTVIGSADDSTRTLVEFDVADLAAGIWAPLPPAGAPDPAVIQGAGLAPQLRINGGDLTVDGVTVLTLAGLADRPYVEPALDATPPSITATYSGRRVTWSMTGTAEGLYDTIALDNGSVLTFRYSTTDGIQAIELAPDGTAVATGPLGTNRSFDGSLSADARGIVQLESTEDGFAVVRYALPSAVPTTPPEPAPTTTLPPVTGDADISGPWPEFDLAMVGPADRYLVPSADIADLGLTVERGYEWPEDPEFYELGYDQWFRADKPGSISTSLLRITTRQGVAPEIPIDTVPAGQWRARTLDAVTGYAIVELWGDAGSVMLWAFGATEEELLSLAERLTRRDGDAPGWALLPPDAGATHRWEPWSEGWNTPQLTERLAFRNAAGDLVAEVQFGCCSLQAFHSVAGGASVLDVDRPAGADPNVVPPGPVSVVVQDTGGLVYAGWVETPIGGGTYGPTIEVAAAILDSSGLDLTSLVAGLRFIDGTSWSAIPMEVEPGDGCNSLFC